MRSRARNRASLWALCLTLAVTLGLLWLAELLGYLPRTDEGHDFILLYSAAQALRAVQNPYDPAIVAQYAHSAGIPWHLLVDNHQQPSQPYVYPPLFAWLTIPLTYLSPMRALAVWRAISVGAMLVSTYGLTALWKQPGGFLGSRGRRLLFAGIVAAAPVTVMVLFWGNPVVLVYAAMGGWVWALTRQEKWADVVAGALMSVALLKFQLALPLALLAVLCLLQGRDAWARRRLMAYGFAAACACWLALDLLATGPALLLAWPRSIMYLVQFLNTEPEMPSLLGLFELGLNGLPSSLSTKAMSLMLVGTALALLVLYCKLRQITTPAILLTLLSAVWLFGAPYGHANDEILLVPDAIALLVALDGLPERWAWRHRTTGTQRGWQVREVVSAGLSVLALGMLYLGGALPFIKVNGFMLPPYVAGLVTLCVLVAMWVALPAFAHHAEATAVAVMQETGPELAATRSGGSGYLRRRLLRGSARS